MLVVALDGAAAAAATAASSGVALFQPSQDPPAVFTRAASGKALGPATVKWAVARALLSMGAAWRGGRKTATHSAAQELPASSCFSFLAAALRNGYPHRVRRG